MMASLLFLASATTSNSAGNMARAYVGTLLVGLASATTSNSAGNMARAYIGAPPKAVGALNMPKAMAPPGAHWP